MPHQSTARRALLPHHPLDGCNIVLSGHLGRSQSDVIETLVLPLGASVSKRVDALTDYLVTTTKDCAKRSAEVKRAISANIPVVSPQWLEDCAQQAAKLDAGPYSLANGSLKRPVSPASGLGPTCSKKGKVDNDDDSALKTTATSKSDTANGQIARPPHIRIPLDDGCPLTAYEVFVDDDGVIYDASLNQTNAGCNNNKFYRIQLLHNVVGHYQTWTRWGRVGERGQSAMLGDGSFGDAKRHFEKKFKDKSGLAWSDRLANPKPGKYAFVERSYNPDSEDETDDKGKLGPGADDKPQVAESKLSREVQDLIGLIFNQDYFTANMADLNYDSNKLPLGKLSKNTITRGFQCLKDLSALLENPSLASSQHNMPHGQAVEFLSNSFYSLIPHDFGRHRPPVISSSPMLKKEIELLESLSDMKDAALIMMGGSKHTERFNMIDRQFKGLNLAELAPLDPKSQEFRELRDYLVNTRGATHSADYQIAQIFRLERQGEQARFDQSVYSGPPRDRRLLWHGSRCSNFGGILSQGLRIAPPESPVSGYMFGKGIYLADMSSKSANYCFPSISNGHALLLLCEAELGEPMQALTNASYNAGEVAKEKGLWTTWGQGQTGPSHWKDAECVHSSLKGVKIPDTTRAQPGPTNVPQAYLVYNEYIVYDVAQIRLRYLFRVRIPGL